MVETTAQTVISGIGSIATAAINAFADNTNQTQAQAITAGSTVGGIPVGTVFIVGAAVVLVILLRR